MIEYVEAKILSQQMNRVLLGVQVIGVQMERTPHKNAWMNRPASSYAEQLIGHLIVGVTHTQHFIRIVFDHQVELVLGEDVSICLVEAESTTINHQCLLMFDNGKALEIKVKFYGFLLVGNKEELLLEQPYFKRANEAIDLLSPEFTYDYFCHETGIQSGVGSVKSALATKQHIPGLGNGILQDILFYAGIRPERKVSQLSEQEKHRLFTTVISTVKEMIHRNGRDQSLDIFGKPGGYETVMTSKRDVCVKCHSELIKKPYLGGKVIYCPVDQR